MSRSGGSRVEPSAAHLALTAAIEGAERVANRAAAMRLQLVLQQLDQAVLDERAAGRPVEAGGEVDRAFAMHIATVLHLSRRTARSVLARGLLLRDELPATMTAFTEGRCSQRQAFAVVDAVDGLDAEQTARLDARAAALVGTMADAQLERALERIRVRIAPDAAIERGRRAATTAGVTASPHRDGMGALRIRTTSPVVAGLYDGIWQAAIKAHARAGETRTFQELLAAVASEAILKGLGHGVREDPHPHTTDGDIDGDGDGDTDRDGDGVVNPATPSELLGTPDAPGTGRIQAQIVVLVPATNPPTAPTWTT